MFSLCFEPNQVEYIILSQETVGRSILQSLAILRWFSHNETFIFGEYFEYLCHNLVSQWDGFELPPEKN